MMIIVGQSILGPLQETSKTTAPSHTVHVRTYRAGERLEFQR